MTKTPPIFSSYSRYYDAFYTDKDYKEETTYVLNLVKRHLNKHPQSLCDAGCGTGKHLHYLESQVPTLYGIDQSADMIRLATQRCATSTVLEASPLSTFSLSHPVDSIVSLFHVISYLTDKSDRQKSFTNIYNHLKPKACFVFDFYYEPAVLNDPPQKRSKTIPYNNYHITRFTTPHLDHQNNSLSIHWNFSVTDNDDTLIETFEETHHMTFFSTKTLEYELREAGFSDVYFYKWMTESPLSNNSWYGVCVAKKS